MTARRSFPWRWLIAGCAIAIVILTIVLPPPGSTSDPSLEDSAEPAETRPANIPEDDPDPAEAEVASPDTVRVLVLNGTMIDGLAGSTQRYLLRSSTDSTVVLAPFDPSDTQHKPYSETVVVSHLPNLAGAMTVARLLELPRDCIVWEVPQNGQDPEVDVTVCIGEDLGRDMPWTE